MARAHHCNTLWYRPLTTVQVLSRQNRSQSNLVPRIIFVANFGPQGPVLLVNFGPPRLVLYSKFCPLINFGPRWDHFSQWKYWPPGPMFPVEMVLLWKNWSAFIFSGAFNQWKCLCFGSFFLVKMVLLWKCLMKEQCSLHVVQLKEICS